MHIIIFMVLVMTMVVTVGGDGAGTRYSATSSVVGVSFCPDLVLSIQSYSLCSSLHVTLTPQVMKMMSTVMIVLVGSWKVRRASSSAKIKCLTVILGNCKLLSDLENEDA